MSTIIGSGSGQPVREEWEKRLDEIQLLLHLFGQSKKMKFDFSGAVWAELKQAVDSFNSLQTTN